MPKKQWSLGSISPDTLYKRAKDPHSGVVESSASMRQRLADEGKPVICAFSRGKDSIAALIALLSAGVDVVPVHLWRVPGLKFEEDSIKAMEDFFQMKIWNLPHRDFWYYLHEGISQAPWQGAINMAANIQEVPHDLMWSLFKEEQGLDPNTWVCDGIRAADSPMRRMSIQRNSPWTDSETKIAGEFYPKKFAHVVWDWKIKDIRECIEVNQVQLPIDYDLWGRTFDGLDYRFMAPMRDKLPDDYATVLEWFPAVEMEMMRYEWIR